MKKTRAVAAALLALFVAMPIASAAPLAAVPLAAAAATVTVTLTSDLPSGQPVGTSVTWTATATGAGTTSLLYRFSVMPVGGTFSVLRDYSPSNTLAWSVLREGQYQIQAAVMDANSGIQVGVGTSPAYTIVTRVTNGQPVVTATAHPLVALFSAPPCPSGSTVDVFFGAGANQSKYTATSQLACNPNKSANFYVGGMVPSQKYAMRAQVVTGTTVANGPWQYFTTGAIPSSVTLPKFTVVSPPNSSTSNQNAMVFWASAVDTKGTPGVPFAITTTLNGFPVWYYDPANYVSPAGANYLSRPLPGGTFLMLLGDGTGTGGTELIREIDLVGQPLHETNMQRINTQLAARGDPQVISFSHELTRLPNGHTLTLGYFEMLCPGTQPWGSCGNVQGGTPGAPVDLLADLVIDLDPNLQVAWTWNPLGPGHLDPARTAILGETCTNGAKTAACPANGLKLASTANDWTHMNAITYSPDGSLLVSVRNQDWIIKVDYGNGAGTGNILWRLGGSGDFTLTDATGTGGTFPWFSHEHSIELNGSKLATFDNGNTRCNVITVGCDSRGQVYALDETAKTAILTVSDDMGNYSYAAGYAQTLANGNYAFTSGVQGFVPHVIGQMEEFLANGTKNLVLQRNSFVYRAYRLKSLYYQ